MKKVFILIVVFAFSMGACNTSGDIEVHQSWARPTMQGQNAAVYFTIHNHSTSDDELVGASSPVADVIEIHESKMTNDIMQMNRVETISLGADEEIIFQPGGYHIMLINIKEEFVLGEHIGLVLHFKNHEDMVVEVHIENSMPAEDHEEGENH